MVTLPGPRVIVHSLAHADAALAAAAEAGAAVVLASAPGAVAALGPPWFLKLVARAAADHPGARATAVLDCGASAGLALSALNRGAAAVRVALTEPARARLHSLAGATGAIIEDAEPVGAAAARPERWSAADSGGDLVLDLGGIDDPGYARTLCRRLLHTDKR